MPNDELMPRIIGAYKKDARATNHFLHTAACAVPKLKPEARKFWLEAKELHLISYKIWRSKRRE